MYLNDIDIFVLDEDFEILGVLNSVISITWFRRYYAAGNFSIKCGLKDFTLFKDGKYIYSKNFVETGVIQSKKYIDNKNDIIIEINGRFLECILDTRIINTVYNLSGLSEDVSRNLVNLTCINPTDPNRVIPKLQLGNYNGLGTQIEAQFYGDEVGKKIRDHLLPVQLSFSCLYDFEEDKINFTIWEGEDKTGGEFGLVVFSEEFDNIIDTEYNYDNSKYKNFVYIDGAKDANGNVVKTTLDLSNGNPVQEMYLDASSIEYNTESTTLTQYINILKQEGRKTLNENKIVSECSPKIIYNKIFKYKQDFDLGDLIIYKNKTFGLDFNHRIIGITEEYNEGEYNIYLDIGEGFKLKGVF